MKLVKYPLHLFGPNKPIEELSILVPEGSKILKPKILNDGIYMWYEIPESDEPLTHRDTFIILQPEQSIPNEAEFIDMVDCIVEVQNQQQGIMIFPIYKVATKVIQMSH